MAKKLTYYVTVKDEHRTELFEIRFMSGGVWSDIGFKVAHEGRVFGSGNLGTYCSINERRAQFRWYRYNPFFIKDEIIASVNRHAKHLIKYGGIHGRAD